MSRSPVFLVILLAIGLAAAGGMAVPRIASQEPAKAEAASPQQTATCGDFAFATDESLTAAPPGCCATQCNVDKDCNKICGRGNCACIQQNPCCRRCVY